MKRPTWYGCAFIAIGGIVAASGAFAAEPPQQGPAPSSSRLLARDVPYPGTLAINVDLTDAPKRIYRVDETIPVRPGVFTMYYPQWILPDHAPDGPIDNIAGLTITGGGKRLPWHRDLRDMYAFHVDVPAGVADLHLSFQYLASGPDATLGDAVRATPNLVDISFTEVAFYPAGYYTRDIRIAPTVTLPMGWQFGTALEVAKQSGNTVRFQPLGFNNFIDSPLIAGKYFNRIGLTPGDAAPVHIDMVGDSANGVKISNAQITGYKNLIRQFYLLFDSHHFQHYDFLLVMSDHVNPDNLEHHQSSDNRMPADFFTSAKTYERELYLPPHEMIHSWNGKFRRPAGMWTPNFNMVEENDLIWVYEGLTAYWAGVLPTRAGMWTPGQYRSQLALVAAQMAHRSGRDWRSLQDVSNSAELLYSEGGYWHNFRRSTDFYQEGQLLWLDVDSKIRELSHGKHSLDDFARLFYGIDNGSYVTRTYTFDELVNALNQVQPFDWAGFLHERLDYVGSGLPEDGILRSGWKLVYTDTPDEFEKAGDSADAGLAYSIGLSVSKNGEVDDVQWDGPAFKAGVVPGMTIVDVGSAPYSGSALRDAVKAAASSEAPIRFKVKFAGAERTLDVDYHGGLKYPHLVRVPSRPDVLDEIVAARH